MPTLTDLHNSIRSVIDSKRIGKPVFVRYLIQRPEKTEDVGLLLAQAATVVSEWMGQSLRQVYAVSALANGQAAVTLSFQEGGCALVCFARGQPRGDGVDVMVLGNRGAIYHDTGGANLWDEIPLPPSERASLKIHDAVRNALTSTKPQPVGKEEKP